MTSSTLNSDPAEPRWAYVWALTALLVLVVAGAWELLVRQAGLGPDYVDSEVLWADTRHRLNSGPTNSIVLLGASRAQRAIDVDTMSEHFVRPVYQLSIEGSSYLPVLENLAVDPRVRGTVVVSIAPVFTFNRLISQVDKGLQAKYLEYYNNQSYARRLEQKLTLALQGKLAFRAPGAKLSEAIPALIETGEMPARDYKTIFRNRVVHIDPELMEVPPTDEGIVALSGHSRPTFSLANASGACSNKTWTRPSCTSKTTRSSPASSAATARISIRHASSSSPGDSTPCWGRTDWRRDSTSAVAFGQYELRMSRTALIINRCKSGSCNHEIRVRHRCRCAPCRHRSVCARGG